MSRIENLISGIIDKILSEDNTRLREKMGLNNTDEELLHLAKDQLAYTENVFPVKWDTFPEYVDITPSNKIALKKEYQPKIIHSNMARTVYRPVGLSQTHDEDFLLVDQEWGVMAIDKDSLRVKDTVLRTQYNAAGYRWYEDNDRIYSGIIRKFSIDDKKYYLWGRVINYGDFVIKCFDENFNYLWMKRLVHDTDNFASRFYLTGITIIDHNNILLISSRAGDTDDTGDVIGDSGVVYVAKINTDANDNPTGLGFYRQMNGYPLAMIGLKDRHVTAPFDHSSAAGIQGVEYINGTLLSLHTGKIQAYNINSLGNGVAAPDIQFVRMYTTPPEIKEWVIRWTAKHIIVREENGEMFAYLSITNPPLMYGIAKIRLSDFKLLSFVGDYLYTYSQQNTQAANPNDIYETTEELGDVDDIQASGTTFGNISGIAATDKGIFVVDYGNRDTKLVPYELFDTVGTIVESKEHIVPKDLEITKVITGSQGKYYISINNGPWQIITGEFFTIPANTPFKIKRKFYAYELTKGELDISLRFLVQ